MPARRSPIALALAVAAGAFGPACDGGPPTDAAAPVLLGDPARPSAPPEGRAAFLAEVSPLPAGGILVVYEVEGPGGLEGTLEVMMRPGGWRRENWTLAMPVADANVELRGSTIQTPDAIYVEGPKGVHARRITLGALADAWLALEPSMRADVLAGVRRMHERRAGARPSEGVESERVLGLACRPERIAAQDVCMWEAAGLPLRAEGGGFRLEAIRVQLDPELGESAFTIPEGVELAPAEDDLNAGVELVALAQGKPSSIGAWLHPGLRFSGPA